MIESRVKPAVLQIECHSYAQRLAIRDKVKPYGIHITCWFLFCGAMSNVRWSVCHPINSQGTCKSPVQIILRWHIQGDFSIIPGASNLDYIKENIAIFRFRTE